MNKSKTYTVFLVDDDAIFMDMLKESFSDKANMIIHSFYSGEDCLANLNLNPDVIVLDYFFSKAGEKAIDGMETLKKIVAANPKINVVMLTAQNEGDKVYEFIHEGAKDYVIKDLDAFENVLSAVTGILEEL
ncbi:MAG: hypothetical protein A2W98_03585 [Bacteroidetes bacterium GWF2_33_38]|nr:MAG: hypothetical protein A2W98_03585 [Bacteroidetes bacterium GWF2_33_38]OFY68195.1 MAG: hypothetical protein A2265_01335 [Bacteroidetes bacterium RIFOXYA12_FULL_33_9]OFY84845.1 MAG: hypothetical protein A2236_09225 [Bacteroidetes bacterium RIFOXYA2_FULL_33_7]